MANDTETNGAASVNGGPWYARLIMQVGVPSAIALLLVWLVAGSTARSLETAIQQQTQILTNVAELQSEMSSAKASMSTWATRSEGRDEVVLRIWRQMCVQQAKTPDDRMKCVQ